MTCEFVSSAASRVYCRRCGMPLGTLGPADCWLRRESYGFPLSSSAGASNVRSAVAPSGDASPLLPATGVVLPPAPEGAVLSGRVSG